MEENAAQGSKHASMEAVSMEIEGHHSGEGISYAGASTSNFCQLPVSLYKDLLVNGNYCPPPYPPGLRFTPTDEDLIVHYLIPKLCNEVIPCNIVTDVDLYSYHPQELTERFGTQAEDAWYYFTSRNLRCANGDTANLLAGLGGQTGYWNPTGSNQRIVDQNGQEIGYKTPLVYYNGRQQSKERTHWMMHEYTIMDSCRPADPPVDKNAMLLDTWVLCKIYHKPEELSCNAAVEMDDDTKSDEERVGADPLEELTAAFPKLEIVEENPSEQLLASFAKLEVVEANLSEQLSAPSHEIEANPLEMLPQPPLDTLFLNELMSSPKTFARMDIRDLLN